MVGLQRKSGDHLKPEDSFSGDYECFYFSSQQIIQYLLSYVQSELTNRHPSLDPKH